MKRFAEFVIKNRLLVLIVLLIITLFFGYQFKNLKVRTSFDDLLPQTHPYIKMHNKYRKIFGGANFLVTMVSVKEGDIFNLKTLGKVKYITEALEYAPGIDRFKIVSIASKKMKNPIYTVDGLIAKNLMYPYLPKDEREISQLKYNIFSNESIYGSYVSFDKKKTLIFADFFEEEIDYRLVYHALEKIRKEVEDQNTTVSMVGHPMHLGVVADMVTEMNYIMLSTLVVLAILLFVVFRSSWATLIIPLSGIVSGIWGVGFMVLLGFNIDPLVFVVPFLISLMAFRHSLQLYNRYYEEFERTNDRMEPVRIIIEKMFRPGVGSIVTDAFGIAIIGITPIPVLQKIAVGGAFWSIITVVIGLIMTPILLSYIPISKGFMRHMEKDRLKDKERRGFANHFGDWLGPWIVRRGKYIISGVTVILVVFSIYWSNKLIVGDAQVG